MGKKGIILSDKHGVNPSINVCFFCGEDKEIVMFGRLKGDAKAPKRIIQNYAPCDKCAEIMKKGRTVIEITRNSTGMLPIITEPQEAWPTGRWCVVPTEDAKKLFKDNSVRPVLLEEELYQKLVRK